MNNDITVSKDAWDSVHEQCSRLRDELSDAKTSARKWRMKYETVKSLALVRCEECGETFAADSWDDIFPITCGERCRKTLSRTLKEDYYGELKRNTELSK